MTNDGLGQGLVRTCILQGNKVYCKRSDYDVFASEYIAKSHHWMIKQILLRQLKSYGWIDRVEDFTVSILSDVSFNNKFGKTK
jgi:hypothetical protein